MPILSRGPRSSTRWRSAASPTLTVRRGTAAGKSSRLRRGGPGGGDAAGIGTASSPTDAAATVGTSLGEGGGDERSSLGGEAGLRTASSRAAATAPRGEPFDEGEGDETSILGGAAGLRTASSREAAAAPSGEPLGRGTASSHGAKACMAVGAPPLCGVCALLNSTLTTSHSSCSSSSSSQEAALSASTRSRLHTMALRGRSNAAMHVPGVKLTR
mmetsp:Transcript_38692/g.114976  ORF Transcript_38692/g.114976 Transcript_38692/m.114976 type:complete len:215 (-) Transcript_38692:3233-3877(-)